MASVPPVSAAEFRDRVMAQRNAAILAEAESEEGVFKVGGVLSVMHSTQGHDPFPVAV